MDRVAGGRKGREMRTLIFPTHRWWEPYTHSKLTQPHQQQYRPHIFLTLTLVGHCKCCAPYQANTRAHTDMASADKAVLTWMPMGENDRWLGGTGAVKTDKQWLSPEPPVTEENPISSVWYRKYIDSTCVQSFIPNTQVKYLCVVIHTRPRSSTTASHALKIKTEFYKCLNNSVSLTWLSRFNVIRVVTTMFLQWIFKNGAARWCSG